MNFNRLNFKRILQNEMSKSNEKVNMNETVDEPENKNEKTDDKSTQSDYDQLGEEELRAEIEERDSELNALQGKLDQAKDAKLRNAAELENYRKRIQRERSKIYDTARVRALEDFLSINDDLSRTLEASEDLDVNQTFLEGVELVAEKFQEVLKKHDVQRIDEAGVPFDVNLHDALMRKKPDDDSVESNTVLEIVENGYKIGDRFIRHAKVIVSE
jgi:molecular chaperone GrpE